VTGLVTGPRSPTNSLQDPQFQINSGGKQARGPNTKCRRRRRKRMMMMIIIIIIIIIYRKTNNRVTEVCGLFLSPADSTKNKKLMNNFNGSIKNKEATKYRIYS
jgi:hypothetical protein